MIFNYLKKVKFRVLRYFYNHDKLANLYYKYYGVKFGKNIRFTGKDTTFGSEPYLIEIGCNVTITQGVKFQTHDGGVGLFRNKYPGINIFGRIKVGDNVFIGEDSMIMCGVTIGNNVVIGAKSLITKDVPNNVVVGGVPARIIRSLEDYEKKSLEKAIFIFEVGPVKRRMEILSKIDQNK